MRRRDRPAGPRPRLGDHHVADLLAPLADRTRGLYVEIKDNSLGRAVTTDVQLRDLLAALGYRSTGQTFDHNELFTPADSDP